VIDQLAKFETDHNSLSASSSPAAIGTRRLPRTDSGSFELVTDERLAGADPSWRT
jgi:hypothetical protein